MRKSRNVSSLKTAGLFLAAGALVLCCMGAFAQGAGGGPGQLPPEKAAKAAELEAQSVAQILSLTPEETTKLVDAYKASRESYMAAMREKLGAAGGGRPDMQAMMDVTKAEQAKLETAIKAFLKPEQVTKAMGYLGTFNRRWDSMVLVLDDMKLDPAKKNQAMAKVADYAAETGKLRMEAAASGNMQSIREKSQALKTKLDADLAGILTPEQVTQWNEATAMRGGGGGGGARRPAGTPPAPPAPAPTAPAPQPAPPK